MKTQFKEIDKETLNHLKQQVREAIAYNLALSPDQLQLIAVALETLDCLQSCITCKDATLHKLRKLLGITRSSEKLSDIFPDSSSSGRRSTRGREASSNDSKHSDKKQKAPRKKPTKPVKPDVVYHHLTGLNKGDTCPCCSTGKLYHYKPAVLLRITGRSPYQATEHTCERLRCNACNTYFTAELPGQVLEDGDHQQKYGYSARTLMTIHKVFAGLPYYRQETLQYLHCLPISASAIYDQVEQTSDCAYPIFKVFKRLAADARIFYIDDTPNRIINQSPIFKKKRRSEVIQLRTGINTSGLMAELDSGHQLTIYQTRIGHAGEQLDETLCLRSPGLPKPVIMSDALSSNNTTVGEPVQALCNAHGRRQYVDIAPSFPDEVEWVLEQYKLIWQHDDEAKAQKMTPAQRLAHHKACSLPIMALIQKWGNEQLAAGHIEENSGLGKAIKYFDKHFEGLTRFCRVEGAPIDNNRMERELKKIILNRKNAHFFKSPIGAAVFDVAASVVMTAHNCGVNTFHYLNMLQRHKDQVQAEPEKWLPWNYENNLKSA